MKKLLFIICFFSFTAQPLLHAMRREVVSAAEGAESRSGLVEGTAATEQAGEVEEVADAERPCSCITKVLCCVLIAGAAFIVAGGTILARGRQESERSSMRWFYHPWDRDSMRGNRDRVGLSDCMSASHTADRAACVRAVGGSRMDWETEQRSREHNREFRKWRKSRNKPWQ